MTAAVTNGEMFKKFGEILRTSLLDTWNTSEEKRKAITQAYGSNLLEEKQAQYFSNLDFLPNFDNIVFIEGIAGSGKTKGVLRMWKRLMSQTNPEIINSKILLAHTSTKKAQDSGAELGFQNLECKDHNSLLNYISSEYATPPLIDGVL
jgi:ABC-type polar amino acid transport system ATPase subunit